MCRVPRVVVIAPPELHLELRRKLSSLDYEIVATVADPAGAAGITADVAVCWEPDTATVDDCRTLGLKVVAVGGSADGDLQLTPDTLPEFKTRVWELFRA